MARECLKSQYLKLNSLLLRISSTSGALPNCGVLHFFPLNCKEVHSHVLVVYDSLTGNVRRFVGKLPMNNVQLTEELVVHEPYILVTYTIGFGQVPETTKRFLTNNGHLMLGVASSGNRNWGHTFGRAGELVAAQYSVPLLHTFELSGNVDDVGIFTREVERIVVESNTKMDRAQ